MPRISISPKTFFLLLFGGLLTLLLQCLYWKSHPQAAQSFRESSQWPGTLTPLGGAVANNFTAPSKHADNKMIIRVGRPLPPGAISSRVHQARVYRWNSVNWEQQTDFCAGNYSFRKTMLNTPFGQTPMYIHESKDDKHVSDTLARSGNWQGTKEMTDLLLGNPALGLVDLGAQLGTFSLIAAKMGRQVVAVDPLLENVLRLCKSVQEGGFSELVTILYVALSDTRGTVTFVRDAGNIGGTKVEKSNLPQGAGNPNVIKSVLLDDVIPFVKSSRVLVKLDVEEHEFQVLTGGSRFLRELSISGIFMEWFQYRKGINGPNLLNLFKTYNYTAYNPYEYPQSTILNADNYRFWPDDILLRKT